ncbi:MAG: hypothetical protein DHS80DRAFT_30524 [Piptocephalis tieghemiana]|nr:MAG: hypothetical protein DHS80DRAFT_30524 [Piptocephalis tieghemiana]
MSSILHWSTPLILAISLLVWSSTPALAGSTACQALHPEEGDQSIPIYILLDRERPSNSSSPVSNPQVPICLHTSLLPPNISSMSPQEQSRIAHSLTLSIQSTIIQFTRNDSSFMDGVLPSYASPSPSPSSNIPEPPAHPLVKRQAPRPFPPPPPKEGLSPEEYRKYYHKDGRPRKRLILRLMDERDAFAEEKEEELQVRVRDFLTAHPNKTLWDMWKSRIKEKVHHTRDRPGEVLRSLPERGALFIDHLARNVVADIGFTIKWFGKIIKSPRKGWHDIREFGEEMVNGTKSFARLYKAGHRAAIGNVGGALLVSIGQDVPGFVAQTGLLLIGAGAALHAAGHLLEDATGASGPLYGIVVVLHILDDPLMLLSQLMKALPQEALSQVNTRTSFSVDPSSVNSSAPVAIPSPQSFDQESLVNGTSTIVGFLDRQLSNETHFVVNTTAPTKSHLLNPPQGSSPQLTSEALWGRESLLANGTLLVEKTLLVNQSILVNETLLIPPAKLIKPNITTTPLA